MPLIARAIASLLLPVLLLLLANGTADAQEALTIIGPRGEKKWSAAELRSHPKAADVAIAQDPVFKRAMTYRAVPMTVLLGEAGIGGEDYVQARAVDNFSVAIPAALLLEGKAFLAVEDPAEPWPTLRKGTDPYKVGPFYIVWQDAPAVSSEYWAYQLATLAMIESPAKRWPQLAVPAGEPQLLHGRDKFVEVCLACHRFQGAGEGTQGPDLGQPMNPVDYFQPAVLKKLLRAPDSVRTWPDRKMPAFSPEMLSDGDLDAIVAWLGSKAKAR